MSLDLTRRRFVKSVGLLAAGSALGAREIFANEKEERFVKEAMFYKKLPELRVECLLCPRKCAVADLERGSCGVRENRGGKYYTLVHSRPCTSHVDPIEKKPFFHYRPGTQAYSIATVGCNFTCKYCQNWTISQFRPEDVPSTYVTPERIVAAAKGHKCRSIAHTYGEPVVFYEYMRDIAIVGKEKGIPSVMISNGYIRQEPMKELCKVLDAVKVDLKGFTEKFYKDICGGTLKPVLDNLEFLAASGVWYEIVILVIPTLNDGQKEIRGMCKWIHDKLGSNVPVHFSRFHPTYLLKNIFPTPLRTLERCYDTARGVGLKYVYLGNVPGHKAEKTYCHNCGKEVVTRVGYTIRRIAVKKGKCTGCGTAIPGVWM